MKSLKLILVALALTIGFGASIANAQDAKRQGKAEKAKASYNLTDEQYKQVKAIYKDVANQKREEANKGKGPELDAAADAKVRELLTPEQQTKFDADQSKKKSGGKSKDGKKPGDKKDGGKKDGGKKKKDAE